MNLHVFAFVKRVRESITSMLLSVIALDSSTPLLSESESCSDSGHVVQTLSSPLPRERRRRKRVRILFQAREELHRSGVCRGYRHRCVSRLRVDVAGSQKPDCRPVFGWMAGKKCKKGQKPEVLDVPFLHVDTLEERPDSGCGHFDLRGKQVKTKQGSTGLLTAEGVRS